MNQLPGSLTTVQRRIFLGLAIFFAMIVAHQAVRYLQQRDAVDLCNKIIGARLVSNGITPYSYFWKKGDSDYFFNPYETLKGKANSITAPPSMLIMLQPLASLSFAKVKWIWLICSYAMMLGSVFLFSRVVSKEKKNLVWSFSIFFFLCSSGWLLHVERGQVYVVYVCLLSLAYYFYRKESIVISLGFLALLVWLRFPFAIFVIPYVFYFKKYKVVLASLGYFLLLLGISLGGSSPGDWLAYRDAVQEWSTAQITQTTIFADSHSEGWRTLLVGKDEGRDFLINNSSVQYLAQYHLQLKLSSAVLWGICIGATLFLLYSFRSFFCRAEKENLFLVAFLGYIVFELCIPAPRYNYTYIQWLFPFLVLLTSQNKWEINLNQYLFLLTGLLLNMGLFFFIPRAMTLGEGSIFLSFCWILWKGTKKNVQYSTS